MAGAIIGRRLPRVRPAALAGLALFALLGFAVAAGMTASLDEWGIRLFRSVADPAQPLGAAWVQEAARDFTALGSNGVQGALAGIACCFLLSAGRGRDAACLVVTLGLVLLLCTLAKMGFGRARPDIVPHGMRVFTQSFPSSHAALSAAMGAMAVLMVRQGRPLTWQVTLAGLAAASLVGVVGGSRVYLGVHWPSDVLAGWALGLAAASLCRAAFEVRDAA